MSKTIFRHLFPIHILLMTACVVFFSFIKQTDSASLSTRDLGVINVLVLVLVVCILFHFILKLLLWLYLSKKTAFFNPLEKEPIDEVFLKNIEKKGAPLGFKLEAAQNEGFSFCYPESWQIIRSKEKTLYMQLREPKLEQGMTILRNFNVTRQNIEGVPNMDFLFKSIIWGVRKAMNAKLEFKESFKNEETFGMRYKLKYNRPMNQNLCCYQIAVTNNKKKSLIILSFTSGTCDFSKTKELFDNIANSVKIF